MSDAGMLIAGRYRLVDRIGQGAMGVIWRARDERLDRVVAVKQLGYDAAIAQATGGMDEGRAALRALREARLTARLRHPHAITVHDVVTQDEKPYLIMEYLPSRNLADILAERDALPPEQVADIGRQLASALAAAHAEGIVHRDVTPGNVLITPTGTVKIADFGISRSAGDPSVTGGGFIAGTPAYLAPEVAGGAEAGFASDVFSLGATLYRALEGKPPFGLDDNPITLLLRVAREEVEPPAHDGPLADVLTRVLQRDPEERPTMAEVCELLAAVAEDRPLPPPRPPRRTATRLLQIHRPRSRRLGYSAAAGVFLLAVGVLIGTSFGSDSPPVAAGPAPLPAPSPTQTSTSTSAPADSGCTARYQVTSSWPGGYQVEVTVRNGGAAPVSGWTVQWTLPAGHRISGLWDATFTQQGRAVTVTNANWNAQIRADGSTSFGLNAVTSGGGAEPAQPTLTCRSTTA